MTRYRSFNAAIAALAFASLTACQAGDKGDAPSAAPVTGAAGGPAATSPKAPAVTVKSDNPCSVLLPNEVGEILGTSISMREVVDEVTCHFDYDKPDAAGAPYLEIKVYFEDGSTVITATRMASKLLGGDAGFEKLSGIGDEAWLGPMASTLVFVKGKAGAEIDLRLVTDGREKGIRLAKLIASRL
jgi:hypothetical protein